MTEKPLSFDELVGELRELRGRVVGLEIRDQAKNLMARAEGPLGRLSSEPGLWTFELGADEPPPGFINASWLAVELAAERVSDIHDVSQGIGPTVVLRIRLADDTQITIWPAMPPGEQWTDRHEANR